MTDKLTVKQPRAMTYAQQGNTLAWGVYLRRKLPLPGVNWEAEFERARRDHKHAAALWAMLIAAKLFVALTPLETACRAFGWAYPPKEPDHD